MKNPYLQQIEKLNHPPGAPNWVRFVEPTDVKTAKKILSWVQGRPPFTYRPGYTGAKDIAELRIDLPTALRIAGSSGSPAGRQSNQDLVQAFYDYAAERSYSSQNPIGFSKEYFRVSRDLAVPVSPLSVIREGGRFVPIFLCGWKKLSLSLLQRRLLMTIYEDAFLSLTDFQDSSSEFLFFPTDIEGKRSVEQWSRGDYNILSHKEVNESVSIFLSGLELAKKDLRRRAAEWRRPNSPEDDHPNLFSQSPPTAPAYISPKGNKV